MMREVRATGRVAPAATNAVEARGRELRRLGAALSSPPPRKFGYFVNNEGNAFRALHGITGIGGGYFGVGTEINFTYAAAAKSSFMVLCDVTPEVGKLHELYRALHLLAPRRADFVRLLFFAPADAAIDTSSTTRMLESAWSAGIGQSHSGSGYSYSQDLLDRVAEPVARSGAMPIDEAREAARLLLGGTSTLRYTLDRVDQDLRQRSWVASDGAYAHVRDLFLDERVLIVTRDVTAFDEKARGLLARAHRLLGADPIRVVYLSNVPDYIRGEPHDRLCESLRSYHGLDMDAGVVIKALDSGSGQPLFALGRFGGGHTMDMTTTVHDMERYVTQRQPKDYWSREAQIPETNAMQKHEAQVPLARIAAEAYRLTRFGATSVDTKLVARAPKALHQALNRPEGLPPSMQALVQGVLAALER